MISLPTQPGIYRIKDRKTGNFYIGSASVSLRKRWANHCYHLARGTHSNSRLQRCWNVDSERLEIEVLNIAIGCSKTQILAREQAWLDLFAAGKNRKCMNVLPMAGSHLGIKRSAATIEKLREVNRGRIPNEATREKMRAAKVGKPLTVEHRKRIGNAVRGKPIKRPLGIVNRSLRLLTDTQIASARADRAAGLSWRQLAQRYPLEMSALRRAILGMTYR